MSFSFTLKKIKSYITKLKGKNVFLKIKSH